MKIKKGRPFAPRFQVQRLLKALVLSTVSSSWNVSAQTCGRSYTDEFASLNIIGGTRAFKGEFPWQVSVRNLDPSGRYTRHFCGGALLNDRWVLTAGHCVVDDYGRIVQPSSLYVRAGEHDETVHEGSEIQVRVTHVYLHPRYVHLHRDVAIVRLAKRLRLSRFVQPICLPPGDILLDPSFNCTISGWGNTFMHGTTSPVLNKLPVPLRPLSDCQQVYGRVFRTPINAWHLCGGSPLGFKGVCYGDSGGPMSCQLTDSRWYLVGLASFGPGCAKDTTPDVYTRVSYFSNWILSTIESHVSHTRPGGIRPGIWTTAHEMPIRFPAGQPPPLLHWTLQIETKK